MVRDGGEGKGHTCSSFTTSMITPPLSMRANPALTAKDEAPSPLLLVSWVPLVVGRSPAIAAVVVLVRVVVECATGGSTVVECRTVWKWKNEWLSDSKKVQ